MAFCNDCGSNVEWHVTRAGKNMPIDPEPHPDGDYYFETAKLVHGERGERPKMFRSHFDSCKKRKPRPLFSCDYKGCTEKGRHRHCRVCGGTDHLAHDCPEAA